MQKIVITTDSTSDLSAELVEKYKVRVIPLYVHYPDRTYRDGVDYTYVDLLHDYKQHKVIPTTSAPSVADYTDLFSELTAQGCQVVHYSIGSLFSASHHNAALAAQELPEVYVVDTQTLSTGSALVVLRAAEQALEGVEAQLIFEQSGQWVEKQRTSFVVNSLEFLCKSGRCSSLSMFGANLLKIKPGILVKDGKMDVGKKYRGNMTEVLRQYARDTLRGCGDIDYKRIFITDTSLDTKYSDILCQTIREEANFEEIIIVKAGCVVTSHCGEDVCGILFNVE